MGEEAHAALRQLQELMAHEVPDGDPAVIVERALAPLLERKLARKAAVVRRPRETGAVACWTTGRTGRGARAARGRRC